MELGIVFIVRIRDMKAAVMTIPILVDGKLVNDSGVEIEIFWENYVNTMAADALATCITRTSAAMVLHMQVKPVLVHCYVSHMRRLSFEELKKMQKYFYVFLSHLPLVPPICISELGQHWFR